VACYHPRLFPLATLCGGLPPKPLPVRPSVWCEERVYRPKPEKNPPFLSSPFLPPERDDEEGDAAPSPPPATEVGHRSG
jgi:hypothetical protein